MEQMLHAHHQEMMDDAGDHIGGNADDGPDKPRHMLIDELEDAEGVAVMDIHVIASADAIEDQNDDR